MRSDSPPSIERLAESIRRGLSRRAGKLRTCGHGDRYVDEVGLRGATTNKLVVSKIVLLISLLLLLLLPISLPNSSFQ